MVTLSIVLLIIGPLSILVAQHKVGRQYMLDCNVLEENLSIYLLWLGYILALAGGLTHLLGGSADLLLALSQWILLTANMLALYALASTAMVRLVYAHSA